MRLPEVVSFSGVVNKVLWFASGLYEGLDEGREEDNDVPERI